MKRVIIFSVALILFGGLVIGVFVDNAPSEENDKATTASETPAKNTVRWTSAVNPKPLSDKVKKGLAWLASAQLDSGAWGQGEEAQAMQRSSRALIFGSVPSPKSTEQKASTPRIKKALPQKETPKPAASKQSEIPSVGDTCMATLALIRSGSTPTKGDYAKNITKGVLFICTEIEKADDKTMYITKTRGTRIQSKLGPFIDTFMASMLLPEVADKMSTPKDNKRVKKALAFVLEKMKKNQRKDGTWSDRGWAATLAQGVAVKGMNRAAQSQPGAFGLETMRQRAELNASKAFDSSTGKFSSKGSAGVDLYSASGNAGALADSDNTNDMLEGEVRKQLKEATTDKERKEAQGKLDRFAKNKKDLAAAQEAVIKRLDDKKFIAGFGNNGGEEFLSYMNIGEGLVVKGGDNWKTWDKSITENLDRVQNKDGSWTGHHCITGRTFCTSAALLVLMVDRAPVPIVEKMKGRETPKETPKETPSPEKK